MILGTWALLLLLCACFTNAASGEPYAEFGTVGINMAACNAVIGKAALFCSGRTRGAACACKSKAFLQTLTGCLSEMHGLNNASANSVESLCAQSNVTITNAQFFEAFQYWKDNAVNTRDIPRFNKSEVIKVPILLNGTSVRIYQQSYKDFYGNYDDSLYYGAGLLGYWLLVLLIGAVSNWTKAIAPNFVSGFTGPVSTLWRRHVSLPATFRKRRNEKAGFIWILDSLVPSRLELLILVGFIFLTGICCAAGIHARLDGAVFATRRAALCRLVADRTGIVALVFMPLVILFAGRNNFLQWITGWNYARYVCFHRWTARVAFLLVVAHAVAFTVTYVERGRYKAALLRTYFQWGIISTIAGGIIMFQGLLRLRRSYYELFLLVHILMAALFIGGAWVHVDGLGYVWFYYAALAVWIFDRVVRIARLMAFGYPKAEVTLVADETFRIVMPRPKYWRAVPGGHAFIHFLRPTCFWQSHPFTFTVDPSDDSNIVMYLKVKGGVTHGLHKYLSAQPGKTTQIRVALEGPYGEPTGAHRYSSAVFVAGGNGIPGIYSEAIDCVSRTSLDSKQKVRLLWIVREYKQLLWFYKELQAIAGTALECTVVVTKPEVEIPEAEFAARTIDCTNAIAIESKISNEKADSISGMEESVSENSSEVSTEKQIDIIHSELSHIKFQHDRPIMEHLVSRETEEAAGSIAFVTCGHPAMVDDLRFAIANQIDKTKNRVEFFEQLQVWS